MKYTFSMRISVISSFGNEPRICCTSLERAEGLVLYITDFKNIFILVTIIYCFHFQKRDFFLCTPTVLEV